MPFFQWISATVAALYPPIIFLGAAVWLRPPRIPGAERWMAANVLMFVALLTFWFGVGSSWIAVGSNALSVAAIILSLEGNREFRGLPPRLSGMYVGGVAAIILIAFFRNQPDSRAAATDFFLVVAAALGAATLFKNIPAGYTLGSRFTGGVFALTATVDLVRAIHFQFMQPGHTGRFVEATSIASFVLAACRPIGWLVLAGERRLMELGEAETHARSMAERAAEANRAKSEFVRMIGHEIRNPLGAILATTDLLLDQWLAPEQRDYLFMLRSAAESLVKVTDDVLDLSILEGGSLTIASAEFDFPAVAADVAKMFEPVARNKGLELTVEYDARMPRLFLGDAGRIRQVIVNLVSNALKFTTQGRIVIRASCETPYEGEARIRLAVSDTGSGIPPEKIAEIFQRTSTVRADGGHGIGLVISRKLIERMGGAVEVESHVGKGSTFWFVLPLRLAQGSTAHV